MKKFAFAMLALAVLVGFASAAYLPGETPETQTISTLTNIKCLGVVFESEDATIMDTNQENPGAAPTALKEIQSISAYSTDLLAAPGYTEYTKSVQVDTNNKLEDQYNIETAVSLEYSGNGAIFDESIYEMGASTGVGKAAQYTICPFGNKENTATAFCNEALATTRMMVNDVNFMSTGGVRSIAGDVLTSAGLDYGVSAVGDGVFTVEFDAMDIDSRTSTVEKKVTVPNTNKCKPPTTKTVTEYAQPSATVSYHERTTALGQFDVTKIISYQSGL